MKFIFSVDTEGNASSMGRLKSDNDNVVTSATFPNKEPREGYEAILKYNVEEGIHWEYIQIPAAKMRERAYEQFKCIEYGEELLTVDEANKLWQEYQAEGSRRAEELTDLIAAAKARIRELYPDEN